MGEIADALRRDRRKERTRSDVIRTGPVTPTERGDGHDVVSGRRVAAERGEADADREAARLPLDAGARAEAMSSLGPILDEKDERDEETEAREVPPVPVVQEISRKADPAYDAARISVVNPSANASHRYRHMAIRLSRVAAERDAESIVVTSPQMGDGKTTTACNLAVALGRLDQGRQVVLVDLDLHRPAVAASLGLDVRVSVGDVLAGKAPLSEALIPTDVGGLHVLASRGRPRQPDALLSGSRVKSLIEALRESFSLVILDTPPVLMTSDAASILNLADACLLVTSVGQSSTRLVKEAMEQVPRDKMIGACVNRVRATTARPEYGYGDYGNDADTDGGRG